MLFDRVIVGRQGLTVPTCSWGKKIQAVLVTILSTHVGTPYILYIVGTLTMTHQSQGPAVDTFYRYLNGCYN
jgi:hypothetical protein